MHFVWCIIACSILGPSAPSLRSASWLYYKRHGNLLHKLLVIMENIRDKTILGVTTCLVCSDKANGHLHYGSIACYSCRAFFRRSVLNKSNILMCTYNGPCEITIASRKRCAFCRYGKCIAVGMREDFVMTEQDKNERKQDRRQRNPGRPAEHSVFIIYKQIDLALRQHQTCTFSHFCVMRSRLLFLQSLFS